MLSRPRSLPKRLAVPLVTLLLVGGVAVVASRLQNGPSTKARGGGEGVAGQAQSLTGDESPIGGGRIVDIATAAAEIKFGLLMPSSELASQSNLATVWSEPDQQEVGLVFESGDKRLVVDLYPAYLEDPKANYQAEIDLHLADQRLIEVLGQPAIVTEPYTDAPKTNPAWLQFDLGGVDVNLFSYQYSTTDLIDVAATLQPLAAPS
jgi:hypothetical protein